jgi:two-component system, NtrC family, response regulator HydG
MPSLPFLGLGTEANLREIGDALPDALFTTDPEGIVTFWNHAAERITGWRSEEAIGQRCSLLAGDAIRGCACGVGMLRCGLAERTRSSKCCTIRTKDGRYVLIVKSAVAICSAGGEPIGALETFTEVGSVEGFERRMQEVRSGGPDPGGGDFFGMSGRDPAMQELYRMIELVARSESTVMILGESGSGKELVAEAIHRLSPRAAGPFVKVSCSALNENLLESELFGHVKGAFPGALRDRRGRFQDAHGGTLLLDEIGDISPLVQVKLLRVIEEREIERLGDSQPIPIDVRLLCATHRELRQLVAEGRFRADLYFRLAVFPLRIPALREHPDDIPLLAGRFLERLRPPAATDVRRVAPQALGALRAYRWPGNVRELQNVLEYAALRAGDGEVRLEHLPAEIAAAERPSIAPPVAVTAVERDEVLAALERSGWSRTRAAEALGISRVTLWKRMKRHGIAAAPPVRPDPVEGRARAPRGAGEPA